MDVVLIVVGTNRLCHQTISTLVLGTKTLAKRTWLLQMFLIADLPALCAIELKRIWTLLSL